MAVTRRTLLLAAGLVPLVHVTSSVRDTASASVSAAAPALRPPARGASDEVCARCGAPGHTALDPQCPRAEEERQARQAVVRRAIRGSGS